MLLLNFFVFSVCFESNVFVSVISKQIRNTETNRNNRKNILTFIFMIEVMYIFECHIRQKYGQVWTNTFFRRVPDSHTTHTAGLFTIFGSSFRFALLFSLRSFSFRLWFPVFRFEAKQAKKRHFFASKRKNFRLLFASFRLNRKRTAHPSLDVPYTTCTLFPDNMIRCRFNANTDCKFLLVQKKGGKF
jgi:hypothetical protein